MDMNALETTSSADRTLAPRLEIYFIQTERPPFDRDGSLAFNDGAAMYSNAVGGLERRSINLLKGEIVTEMQFPEVCMILGNAESIARRVGKIIVCYDVEVSHLRTLAGRHAEERDNLRILYCDEVMDKGRVKFRRVPLARAFGRPVPATADAQSL